MLKTSLVELDAACRRAFIGAEPMVFHCHHYNTFLQRSIRDASYLDTEPFLVSAASEVAHSQLRRCFAEAEATSVESRRELAEELYRSCGFGTVDLQGLAPPSGETATPNSHYAMAWNAKFGEATENVDFFTRGWIAGAVAAIHDRDAGALEVTEDDCAARGAEQCRFTLSEAAESRVVPESVGKGPLTTHEPWTVEASGVDYEGVFTAVTGMELAGNDLGHIPAFGVYLTRHYANYYNRISFEFERTLTDRFGEEGRAIAEPLLVEAGHVCAFNTFGGIMTSPEWDALIKPNLETRQDWVHGITAVVNALGWGRWQVRDVSPERAEFVIHDDYESVGYLGMYGEADHDVAYLARGAAMGIMDLVYLGDIHERPELTPQLYTRLFKGSDAYRAEVTRSRGRGDDVTCIEVRAAG